MTTAKPPYHGNGCGTKLSDFSDELRQTLRSFDPRQGTDTDPYTLAWGDPADAFVEAVLSEAWWAKSELHFSQFNSGRAEIRAEQADLLKRLRGVHDRLRRLSPDFDRLLGIDADPLGCADKIKELIGYVEAANPRIDQLPNGRKTADKEHNIAVELAIRVLGVVEQYGGDVAATAGTYWKLIDITEQCDSDVEASRYVSPAVKILKAIGDDMGLVKAEATWRGIIGTARQAPSGLRARQAPEK